MSTVSLLISGLALCISLVTAWVTLFRRGELKMTQPTVIYFGPDADQPDGKNPPPKVYLRTLLFSTGKRGRMIESLHVRIARGETAQNFNIWVYGEEKLSRGSGLFVGEEGITSNHHFLAPADGSTFQFIAGEYQIEILAKVMGKSQRIKLWSQHLVIESEHASALQTPGAGLYFDWGADSGKYVPHIKKKSPVFDPLDQLI